MRDTPRTDEVWELFATDTTLEPDVEFSTLARTLERELNAANDEIEEKRKDIVYLATEKAKLEDRIKRLIEAGDEMHKYIGVTHDSDKWNEAKEETKQ